jgi:hypothetical protein
MGDWRTRLIDLGWLGVDRFFVISGFLIVTLLIRERERRGTVSLRKFYARRSWRHVAPGDVGLYDHIYSHEQPLLRIKKQYES